MPSLSSERNIVCVVGLIGAGKSTFIAKAAQWCQMQGLSCKHMKELQSRALLAHQASNTQSTEGFYFGHRVQMAIDSVEIASSYDLTLMESGPYSHLAFVRAMEKRGMLEKGTSDRTYQAIKELSPPHPTRYLCLDATPEIAYLRQQQRDDGYESIFDKEFAELLASEYKTIIQEEQLAVIYLDWKDFGSEYDFDNLMNKLISSIRDM